MITYTNFLAIVRAIIAEDTNAFSDTNVQHATNAAILSVHSELYRPIAPATLTMTTGTNEYSVPANFVYIDEIRAAGIRLLDAAWELKTGTTPKIVFKAAYYTPTTGTDPVVCGMGVQCVVSDGAHEINIDPGYILYRTLANIHSALGGTSSDMSAWHQAESTRLAELAEARLADEFVLAKFRPTPGARLVPGRSSDMGAASTDQITDPGASGAIPVTASGWCALVSAAAETRTIAAPTFIGQEIDLFMDTRAVGDITATAAVVINVANNNTMVFGAASERILLRGVSAGGTKEWSVVANDGVALSTV